MCFFRFPLLFFSLLFVFALFHQFLCLFSLYWLFFHVLVFHPLGCVFSFFWLVVFHFLHFLLFLVLILLLVCFGYMFWVLSFHLLFLSFFIHFSLAVLCGLLALGCLAMGQHLRGRSTKSRVLDYRDFLGLGNINQHALSPYPSQHQDLAPVSCLQVPILATSCQTTSKIGTYHPSKQAAWSHKWSHRHLKTQNPTAALTIRQKRLSATHQNT